MSSNDPNNFTHRHDSTTLELVEYGDFTCPRCQSFRKVLATILPIFEGVVHYTFRCFPNLLHPQAFMLATATEAARRQGKHWIMHQALFTHASTISLHSLSGLALALGLKLEPFLDDLHDERVKQVVWSSIEQGRLDGVVRTPTLFLGTHRLHGKLTQARLLPLIRQHVNRATSQVLGTVDTERGLIRWSSSDYQ
ncbi:DsbA family protein [Spirosoma arcticum]